MDEFDSMVRLGLGLELAYESKIAFEGYCHTMLVGINDTYTLYYIVERSWPRRLEDIYFLRFFYIPLRRKPY